MLATLLFNLINFLLFLIYYQKFFKQHEQPCNINNKYNHIEEIILIYTLGILGMIFFSLSALFFVLSSCLDPGYVKPAFDLIVILQS